MIDTDKYEGHQPAPWRWVKPMGMHEWFLFAVRGNHSNLNHQRAGGIWLPDTFCRLGKGLDPTQKHDKSTYDLIADAPKLLAEVKRLVRALRNADDVIEYALEMTSDDDATRVFEDYLEVNKND
tara:strand:+ start:207 stop:578 length:372 start_codon:yes stop_codon:yes gene_type:complete